MSDCNVISSLLYYYWELSQHQPPMTPLLRRLFIDRSVITRQSYSIICSVLFIGNVLISFYLNCKFAEEIGSTTSPWNTPTTAPMSTTVSFKLCKFNVRFFNSTPESTCHQFCSNSSTYMICSFQSNVGLTISSSTNTANPEIQASASARLVSHS